jgi:hypothetical protein
MTSGPALRQVNSSARSGTPRSRDPPEGGLATVTPGRGTTAASANISVSEPSGLLTVVSSSV